MTTEEIADSLAKAEQQRDEYKNRALQIPTLLQRRDELLAALDAAIKIAEAREDALKWLHQTASSYVCATSEDERSHYYPDVNHALAQAQEVLPIAKAEGKDQ